MLKAPKKLTKRQIKEDKFVTFYLQAQDYLNQHARNILMGTGVVVILIVASVIFSKTRAQKEQSSSVELTKGRIEYSTGNYSAAIDILKNLIDVYGNTTSGKAGIFYLADAYFQSGNYVNAEKYFQKYLDEADNDILSPSAMSGLAACFEQEGNYEMAAQKYRESADKYSKGFQAPENYYNAARCYKLAGNVAEAKILLEKLIDQYPNSTYKNKAEISLAEMNLE